MTMFVVSGTHKGLEEVVLASRTNGRFVAHKVTTSKGIDWPLEEVVGGATRKDGTVEGSIAGMPVLVENCSQPTVPD